MKELIKRWLGMPKPLDNANLFERLQEAHKQHISDLRVLIDQGNGREAVLASMLQEAISKTKQQPAIRAERKESPEPPVSLDHLNDVAVFDEDADAALMQEQEEELAELIAEQEAEGITKP